ncbi:MAG: glycosyltransferase family 4 protein [Verrucomicrobia bacterium]|nr:glycosyltransferase family 4 protein [Verrucomicrobiota bacterium]
MTKLARLQRIAVVGNYLPRRCGIATFTHDLCRSMMDAYPGLDCLVVPVTDTPEGYAYPPEVRFELQEQDLNSYQQAADFLNFSNVEALCVQHEFGVYGGHAGSHLLTLLRKVQAPVVTTLHTILQKPNPDQQRVMQELCRLSDRLVVMTQRGFEMMREIYGAPEEKLDLIPHGIPDMPFVDPNFYKDQFGVEGKKVVLTFGLLSPNKGIEYVIQALPKVVREIPDLVYIVLGATHPNLLREQGEAYRLELERLAAHLNVKKHVVFYNRFVELEELKEFLGAADIYITPYLNKEQITSGTLSYAFGCGKAVISTPYWHAEELLADGRGVLVPFRDSDAIAETLLDLLKDEVRRHAMRKQAYLLGREMIWGQVAHLYMASLDKARQPRPLETRRRALQALESEHPRLPGLRLSHLKRLTDTIGLFQHASYTVPNFHEGYCADDNSRAFLLTVLLELTGDDSPEVESLAHTYAAFLHYAFLEKQGWFRNFMGFDRRWRDEGGSEDCFGRAVWALGACVGRSKRAALRPWAAQLFDSALPSAAKLKAPRGWAYTLLGIHEYLRRLRGDRLATQAAEELCEKLLQAFENTAGPDWVWFEPALTYANARLPQALIQAGRWLNNEKALEIGLQSLRWLMKEQTADAGHFRPIGCHGFYPRGKAKAQCDQQPIEACCSVSACLEAFYATREEFWLQQARLAFDWFLGRNDLNLPLYNPKSGGCYDGLMIDRLNNNQGAESTLSFLLALQEMRLLEQSLRAFEQPVDLGEPEPEEKVRSEKSSLRP